MKKKTFNNKLLKEAQELERLWESSGFTAEMISQRLSNKPRSNDVVTFKRKFRYTAKLLEDDQEILEERFIKIDARPWGYGNDDIGRRLWTEGMKLTTEITWLDSPQTIMDALAEAPNTLVVALYDGYGRKMEEWTIPYADVKTIQTEDFENEMITVTFEYTKPPQYWTPL